MRRKDRVYHPTVSCAPGLKLRRAAALVLFAVAGSTASSAAADEVTARGWLQQRIAELADDKRIEGAQAAVLVVDLSTGEVVGEHDRDAAVSVASNAKLFTSAAALSTLGPGFRFQTTVLARRRRGRQVIGDLYVKGYGDPSIREETLWRLARDVRNAGVREVSGGLTIDESYLDGPGLPPLFETRTTDAYYRPAVGALSLEDNAVWIGVQPAAMPGKPATIRFVPRCSHVRVEGTVQTVAGRARRRRLTVGLEQRGDSTVIVVDGRIGHRRETVWLRKRVGDPGLFFATALQRLLRQNGVRLGRQEIRRGQVPRRSDLVVRHQSESLGDVLRVMNKTSSNAQAELLLKVLGAVRFGRQGSTRLGLQAVGEYLAGIGLNAEDYMLRNGSGLYEATRFSPRQVVQLLSSVYQNFRYGSEFVSSLAIAGIDGTLGRRFRGSGVEGYVRAKTGTLSSVVALSGYAGASAARPPVAFSILLANLRPGTTARAREVADELCRAIVTYLEQGPAVRRRSRSGADG